jgi:hypothetical protein
LKYTPHATKCDARKHTIDMTWVWHDVMIDSSKVQN